MQVRLLHFVTRVQVNVSFTHLALFLISLFDELETDIPHLDTSEQR